MRHAEMELFDLHSEFRGECDDALRPFGASATVIMPSRVTVSVMK